MEMKDEHGRFAVLAPLVLAGGLGLLLAVAAALVLLRGPAWIGAVPLPAPPALPPATGLLPLIAVGLLGLILLALAGIFVLLLLLVVCVCGCHGGGIFGLLGRIVAALLPGLTAALRQAAQGLQHAAGVAGATVAPLHTVGVKLTEVGATMAALKVPKVAAQTELFWTALRRALRDSPAHIEIGEHPPDGFPRFLVLSSFAIDPAWAPLGGEEGIGWWVTYAGEQTYAAGSRASEISTDLQNAASGLDAVATTLETVPGG